MLKSMKSLRAKLSYEHVYMCGWGVREGGGQRCTLAIITPEWLLPYIGFNSTSSWETRRSKEISLYKELYSHSIKHSRFRNPVVIFAQCSHNGTKKFTTIFVYFVLWWHKYLSRNLVTKLVTEWVLIQVFPRNMLALGSIYLSQLC